jgi:NADH:ubiquinone oxidoreductase subunit E
MAHTVIKICGGNACSQNFSRYIVERAKHEVENHTSFEIQEVGCQGKCENGPTVMIEKNGKKQVFSRMNPVEMGKLIQRLTKEK